MNAGAWRKRPVDRILLLAVLVFLGTAAPAATDKKKAVELNQVGVEAVHRGEFEEAIKSFKAALYWDTDNAAIRTNLARISNQYAVRLLEKGEVEQAIIHLEQAIELEPGEGVVPKNLSAALTRRAMGLYEERSRDEARGDLERALELDESNFTAWALLGEIAYLSQELARAREYWQEALRLNPDLADVRKKLTKLEDEYQLEQEFRQRATWVFDINYDKEIEGLEIEYIRNYLREAYRVLGRKFNYYPQEKVVVLIYQSEDFKGLDYHPDWAAGIYDGKIRIPLAFSESRDRSFLKSIIWHEYVHVLVRALSAGNCPAWLNEGLAKYLEPDSDRERFHHLRKAVKGGTLIPLVELEKTFTEIKDEQKVKLAYEEAQSAVEFIVEYHRFHKVREVLNRLQTGKNPRKVVEDLFVRGGLGLEQRWRRYLEYRFK